jgi:hypothetical protein
MVATQVKSPTNSPASEQVMNVLMDAKALPAGYTTAATAVEANETQTADAENETATPAVEAPEPEDAATNVNVEEDTPTSPPPQAFYRLKKLDPTVNAIDYFVKDEGWDVEGIKSDIALCRKFKNTLQHTGMMTDHFDDSKPSAEAAIASETERVQPPKSPDIEADNVSAEAASTTEAESPSPRDTMMSLGRKRTISACEALQEDKPPTKNSKESPL